MVMVILRPFFFVRPTCRFSLPLPSPPRRLLSHILAPDPAPHPTSFPPTSPPPPHILLRQFFLRSRHVRLVVDLLMSRAWDHSLQRSLQTLPVTFDTLLVTQILRVNIPCGTLLEFFRWLKIEHGFKHNEFTYSVILNTLGRMRLLEAMQQLFDEMKSDGCPVTRVTLSNVMLWFSRANDTKGVSSHWISIRRSGIKPSAAMYAVYIDFLVKKRRYAEVAIIFEEMLRTNCLPSSRTYTAFIKHLVDNNDVQSASQILRLMQTIRVVPSRVTYTIVIGGFAKAGNVDMVLDLLTEMEEHFYLPDQQLMPTIRTLLLTGKVKEVTKLFERMPSGTELSGSIENLVDDAEDDLYDDSMNVWKNVTCVHVEFDVNAFCHALRSWNPNVEEILDQSGMKWPMTLVKEILMRLRSLQSMWSFFHWLRDKQGFTHDSCSCALIIQSILKSRSSLGKKALMVTEIFEALKKDKVQPSVSLFNLVIRYYISVGEAEKAYTVLRTIKEFELVPNKISYTLLIQGFAKNCQEKKALTLLREMESHGFHLDNETCADLITCLEMAGKTKQAYTLFCKFLESGAIPGPLEYKAIMQAYVRIGDNGMALKLYEDMCKAGIKPTQSMFDVVSRVLKKTGRISDLETLVHERGHLNFFDGNKKVLQETLLHILSLFTESVKPEKNCNVNDH